MVKGIIRRLDELGRVVIPREYRRMYDINPGDPMEMYALDNGDIVVRKVNLSSQLEFTSQASVKALSDALNKTVLVSDLTCILSGCGTGKAPLLRRQVPSGIVGALKAGKTLSTTTANDNADVVLENSGFDYFAACPIVYGDEVRGGLYLLSREPVTEEETLLLKTAAAIISESLPKV